MTKSGEERVNGKLFIENLDKCKSKEDVFDLLNRTMDRATLKDRVSHTNNNDLINQLNSVKARVNIEQGCRTSHMDCVTMAADKYRKLTGKGINDFRMDIAMHNAKEDIALAKTSKFAKDLVM